ncbi:hypothetical protein [Prochlorococcus marinus]|uniref:Uncharacterized protein n=1 Tax=Prochlorococcus marinus (strain MIT 9211) TaxID=93059 RepID=A9BAA6_PROM4|nr:hypothetical protein [Prochlorococcus marinus]ABX08768.1 conserved hypothetical protein [Prochlorococcus marinus str. MIT 9211]
MAKRRRKLSKDYEKLISKSEREVELYIAKINDIDDDDIRTEYTIAFSAVKSKLDYIKSAYTSIGYNEDSDTLMLLYQESLKNFISEYEI